MQHRTKSKRFLILFLAFALMLTSAIAGCKPYTIVTVAEATRVAAGNAFDAESFVAARWGDVTATILEKAVDLSTVLTALANGSTTSVSKEALQSVADQYGLTTEGNAQVFMVKGQGTVSEVNTEKSTGWMTLQLDGYDGPIAVKLFIGTRIPSDETSIRDGVGFIKFGDFREQTEYGKVGRELNRRVLDEVLAKLDRDNLQGKSISFYGAFTVRTQNIPGDINIAEVIVTPVQLEVGG